MTQSNSDVADTVLSTMRDMREQMDAQAERIRKLEQALEWVSVEERLPESGECVLVWWYGHPYMGLHYGEDDALPGWRDEEGTPMQRVTHWMPLPTGPEKP